MSSGRLERRCTRWNSSSKSALIQTETAVGFDQRAGLGIHEGAAAGAQHEIAVLEQAGDDARFAGAEIGLAVRGEDVLDGHAGGRLDLVVAVDEVAAEPAGEAAADGGLAGAHHADEHDRPAGEQGSELVLVRLPRCGCGGSCGLALCEPAALNRQGRVKSIPLGSHADLRRP